MEIIVKKPNEEEINAMKKHPTWGCEISEFDWYYDSEEHCYLLEGKVLVEHEGGSCEFSAGDYVILPKGLKCVWKVSAPVKKHYTFL